MLSSRFSSLLAIAAALGCCMSASAASAIDPEARVRLVRSAAQKAGLADVGLDHRDLYGIIHAESGWVSRSGLGKNGVVSEGLAQFEPATARAVGLRNPHDPQQAVEAAAVLLREAAQWSARKLQGLQLAPGEWEKRLREGVSIYYNLSTRTRNAWNGRNSDRMPVETQQHIRNARHGALLAGRIESGAVTVASPLPAPDGVASPAAARPRSVEPQPVQLAQARVTTATIAGIPQMRRTSAGIELPQGKIEWSRPHAGG